MCQRQSIDYIELASFTCTSVNDKMEMSGREKRFLSEDSSELLSDTNPRVLPRKEKVRSTSEILDGDGD
jgi:hypothetical protein